MQEANAPKKQQARLPPALNPEQPAITQPYRELVARGFISSLELKISGVSITMSVDVGPMVKVPEGTSRKGLTPFAAKQYIIESKLWEPSKLGSKGKASKKDSVQLPKRSLVKEDFAAEDDDLKKRALAVAKALSDQVAVGRIGSLKMMRAGVDNFEKWWSMAPPSAKSRLLADGKHHSAFDDADHERLSALMVSCPFRGPVPTPSEEEPEDPTPKVNGAPQGSPKSQGRQSPTSSNGGKARV